MTQQDNHIFRFFTASQATMMETVLNQLIPGNDKYQAAGDIGILQHLDEVLSDQTVAVQGIPDPQNLFKVGMLYIDKSSEELFNENFVNLNHANQTKVLVQVEKNQHLFFSTMVHLTYNGYYTNQSILETCEAPIRPPQPDGHYLEPGDLSSLSSVQARGQAYRDAPE